MQGQVRLGVSPDDVIILDNFTFTKSNFHSGGLTVYDLRPEKERKEAPYPPDSQKGTLYLELTLKAYRTHSTTSQIPNGSVTETRTESLRKMSLKGMDREDTIGLYILMVTQLSNDTTIVGTLRTKLRKLYKVGEEKDQA